MTTFTTYREFDVKDGKTVISSGEIRYRFKVTAGRAAITWANADEGFSPPEGASVDVIDVAIRMHHKHPWRILDGIAFDAFCSDVPDAWFLDQIKFEEAEAE